MLNYDKLAEIVEEYKKAFQERWDDEKFKWVAAKHFQDNWDISAPDFLEMFCRATDKTHNLLTSRNFFPLGMMIDLIKVAPEVVRSIFKGLFDEGQPLGGRIQTFISNIDTLNSRYFPNKNHYQTDNAISTYLWLRYPDKYYIYKYSEYKKVIKLISPETEFKKGDKNNILTGFKLYDEICDYLYKDIELRNMLKQSLTTDCYPDNFLKTLTIDVGYYVSRQVMDKNAFYNHIAIHALWQQAEKLLKEADEVYIIGFSFPQTDLSVKYLFQSALRKSNAKIYVVNPEKEETLRVNYNKVFGDDNKNVCYDYSGRSERDYTVTERFISEKCKI